MGYDIIGDIHGQAGKLVALLARMGYREEDGAWRHPDRTAIFVGDFIDRGPWQLKTVRVVQAMVTAGSAQAIMGNHEFNAIAWYLPDPEHPGEYLRQHTAKNRHQHAAFLREVEHDPALHRELIDWFLTLPLWLDLPELRVVHACWHPGYMAELAPYLLLGNRLDAALVEAGSRSGSMPFRAIEGLTKGLEAPLPEGHAFRDKDGHERRNVRIQWWNTDAATFRQAAWGTKDFCAELPETPIPEWTCIGYPDDKPLFFGHYWHSGELRPFTPRIACVDYSAGKGGPLVAYRWDGEKVLDPSKFITSTVPGNVLPQEPPPSPAAPHQLLLGDGMDIIWDGIRRAGTLSEEAAARRGELADAAKHYDWERMFDLLSQDPSLVNSSRPDGTSLYAPLHQVAHAGAPVGVAQRLVEMGAWRTLQNVRGERPVDVALRMGHRHLLGALMPAYVRHVPPGVLLRIQAHFHDVIRSRAEEAVRKDGLRLPELEPLLELQEPRMWFPVPDMYGGFSYWLEVDGVDAKLVSESWSRMNWDSEQKHKITPIGSTLIEDA